MNDKIGLIISGCKGGYRVICTNNAVNPNDPRILNTVRDLRGFIRFNENKLNVYSLEFTDRYKVYAISRSLNDSGTGGYISVSLFVPHDESVNNVREVLDTMMDTYFNEYVHPLYGTYIPGKFDDIKPFINIFGQVAEEVNETRKSAVRSSIQDNTVQVVLYKNAADIDQYLRIPYRKEFYESQKVLFMSEEIYKKIPASLRFEHPEKLLDSDRISPPEPLPKLKIDDIKSVKSIKVNGVLVEYGIPENPIELADMDSIEIVLSKKYYEDKPISGKVEDLLKERILTKSGNYISLKVGSVVFTPKTYYLKFTLDGGTVPKNRVFIYDLCYKKWEKYEDIIDNCNVCGNKLSEKNCTITWGLIPLEKDENKIPSKINLLPAIDDATNDIVNLDLKTKKYTYVVKTEGIDIKPSELSIDITGTKKYILHFSLDSTKEENKIEFDLPSDYDEAKFKFDFGKKFTFDIEGHEITVTLKTSTYKLDIRDSYLSSCDWDFLVDGKSKRTVGKGVIKMKPDEASRGVLKINDFKFEFEINQDGDYLIIPRGYLIVNLSSSPIEVNYKDTTYDISKWNIFPEKPVIDESKYDIQQNNYNNGLNIWEVYKKSLTDVSNNNRFYDSIKNVNDDYPSISKNKKNNVTKSVKVTFYNCKGGKFQNAEIVNDEEIRYFDSEKECLIIDKKKCTLLSDLSKSTRTVRQGNEDNGFKVECIDTPEKLEYKVTYQGKFGIDWKDFLRTRRGFAIIGVVLVVIIIAACCLLIKPSSSDVVAICDFEIVDTLNIKELKDIEKIIPEQGYEEMVKISDSISTNLEIMFDNNLFKNKCKKNIDSYLICLSDMSIEIVWEEGGYKESFKLKDLDGYKSVMEVLRKYKQSLDNNEEWKKISKEIVLKIYPPASKEASEFITNSSNLKDKEYYEQAKSLVKEYPILKNYLTEKCWSKVNKEDGGSINTYKDALSRSGLLYGDSLVSVEKIINGKNDAQANAENEYQLKKQFEDEIDNKINQLHSENCTSTTVDNVKKWYSKLDPKNKTSAKKIEAYIEAYTIFFNAKNIKDIKKLNRKRSMFSDIQRKVIFEGYGKDPKSFDNIHKLCGMSFSKPIDSGFVK